MLDSSATDSTGPSEAAAMAFPLLNSCIVIVDDEPANVALLERSLRRAGYRNLHGTTDARRLQQICERENPDLVLLDLHMPGMNGFQAMASIEQHIANVVYMPILVLTGDVTPATRHHALECGAMDYLTKPFDLVEVQARIRNLLYARALHVRLESEKRSLAERVEERTRELIKSRLEALDRLAFIVEYRDDETGLHTRRVGQLAADLAELLGRPSEEVEVIRHAAPLHDVGKVAIPDSILLKAGKLDDAEYAVMQRHTEIGAQMLSGSASPYLQAAREIALTHHEHWDGTGYPRGLHGTDIPFAGRLVAVADYYDALTHDRPYRPALPRAQVLADMLRKSARHFDPEIVDALSRLETTQARGRQDSTDRFAVSAAACA